MCWLSSFSTCSPIFQFFPCFCICTMHFRLWTGLTTVCYEGRGVSQAKEKEVLDVNMPNLIIKVKLLMLLEAQELCWIKGKVIQLTPLFLSPVCLFAFQVQIASCKSHPWHRTFPCHLCGCWEWVLLLVRLFSCKLLKTLGLIQQHGWPCSWSKH